MKNYIYKVKFIIFLFSILIILSCNSQEIGGRRDHVKDAEECFGIAINATPEAQSIIKQYFTFVYKEIDQGGNNCQGERIIRIKERFVGIDPDFNVGNFGHRLFFHNGFNEGRRWNVPNALQLQFFKGDEKTHKKYFHEYKRKIEDIYVDEQTKFYKDIKNKFQTEPSFCCLGFHEGGNGISLIKIIYDIHILGDYIEAKNDFTRDALMPFGELMRDLRESIENCGYDDIDNLNQLTDREFAKHCIDEQQAAKENLEALKIWFPKVIKNNKKLREAVWGK